MEYINAETQAGIRPRFSSRVYAVSVLASLFYKVDESSFCAALPSAEGRFQCAAATAANLGSCRAGVCVAAGGRGGTGSQRSSSVSWFLHPSSGRTNFSLVIVSSWSAVSLQVSICESSLNSRALKGCGQPGTDAKVSSLSEPWSNSGQGVGGRI